MRFAVALVALVVAAGPAWAAPRCAVKVIKNVGAEDDPSSVLPKGSQEFGPVTEVRVLKNDGRMSYCAHGSFCYSAAAFDFISGCRFTKMPDEDPAAFLYDAE